MSTFQRFGIGLFSTFALFVGGVIYRQVFADGILPLVDTGGQFSTPVVWLDNLIPFILLALLLAVWAWVIAGAVQDERTVNRRRVR